MMPLQLTALQLAPLLLGLLCSRATTAFQFFLKQGQGSHSASTSPPFTNSWRREEQPNNGRQSSDLFASTTSINIDQKQLLPGTAQLDTPWEELGFEFRPTRSHLRMVYRDGSWQAPELVSEPYIQLHIGATALHYGQACFEGLKAFCHSDNTVHLFRPDENAARMQSSCRRTLMPELPTDLFVEACKQVVKDNLDYVPPYGSNGALYIRPLLFGSGPRIGLQPADEYTFLCMVIPVGDYYKGGLSKPVHGRLITDYDRAAPRGVVRIFHLQLGVDLRSEACFSVVPKSHCLTHLPPFLNLKIFSLCYRAMSKWLEIMLPICYRTCKVKKQDTQLVCIWMRRHKAL